MVEQAREVLRKEGARKRWGDILDGVKLEPDTDVVYGGWDIPKACLFRLEYLISNGFG